MRSNSGASSDLFRAVDGYTRAMTALMSMPARWACDFTSAFETAARRPRSSGSCDPCPPKCETSCDPCPPTCENSCEDQCCDPCSPQSCNPCDTNACGCGDPCCSKCGQKSRRFWEGSTVELSGGRIGKVYEIDDCVVTINFDGELQKYAKSSICRVVRPCLQEGALVRTVFGLIGTIEGYDKNRRFMTLVVSASAPGLAAALAAATKSRSAGTRDTAKPEADDTASIRIPIDRSAICEVLYPDEISEAVTVEERRRLSTHTRRCHADRIG